MKFTTQSPPPTRFMKALCCWCEVTCVPLDTSLPPAYIHVLSPKIFGSIKLPEQAVCQASYLMPRVAPTHPPPPPPSLPPPRIAPSSRNAVKLPHFGKLASTSAFVAPPVTFGASLPKPAAAEALVPADWNDSSSVSALRKWLSATKPSVFSTEPSTVPQVV